MINNINDQEAIKVYVEFYDDKEKDAILDSNSKKDEILKIVNNKNGYDIPIEDFLVFYLYHKRGNNVSPEYENIKSIRQFVKDNKNSLIMPFNGFIECSGPSIRSLVEPYKLKKEKITEYIGESVGLSLFSEIYELGEQDWVSIDEHPGNNGWQTMDYETYLSIASTGTRFVQIEAKGRTVPDNTNCQSMSDVVEDIKGKKDDTNNHSTDYLNGKCVRYGTITILDMLPKGILRCKLVDPFPKDIIVDPEYFRLITRMQFLYDWISFVAPRSQLTAALYTRIKDLKNIEKKSDLKNKILTRTNGKPFKISTLVNNKSHTTDGSAVGQVIPLSEKEYFFIGIDSELFTLAIEQNWDQILKYKYPHKTKSDMDVECVFSTKSREGYNFSSTIKFNEKKKYYSIILPGRIHYSRGGLIFGWLSTENIISSEK